MCLLQLALSNTPFRRDPILLRSDPPATQFGQSILPVSIVSSARPSVPAPLSNQIYNYHRDRRKQYRCVQKKRQQNIGGSPAWCKTNRAYNTSDQRSINKYFKSKMDRPECFWTSMLGNVEPDICYGENDRRNQMASHPFIGFARPFFHIISDR